MRKLATEDLIRLLRMVGIVGSLIFLGLEMRQSQIIAIAGQTQARNEAIMDFQLGISTSENAASRRLFHRGNINILDPSDLSKEESSSLRHKLDWRANSSQNAFQRYQLGLLDENVWKQFEARINDHWQNCYSRPSLANIMPSLYDYLESKTIKYFID